MAQAPDKVVIGIDVGSTTVKMTVVDPTTKEILWSEVSAPRDAAARDDARDAARDPRGVSDADEAIRSAASSPAPAVARSRRTLGAKFVQEVNAVTMAVEKLHPDVGSVIELGGQDAKIIMFKKNKETGDKTAQTSMNDKCASGTGATIDKCVLKVGMPREEVPGLKFDPTKLHHVAAKCGVFAETDIVNLVKCGIPRNEIMNSLADAIVSQNLAVLTRGNTLKSQGPPARRSEHVPAVPPGVLAPPHPRGVGRARLRVRQDGSDRGADLRPEELRPLRRVRRGAVRPLRARDTSARTAASIRSRSSSTTAARASSARRAGPGLVEASRAGATRSPRSTRRPTTRTPCSRPARPTAA